MNVGLSQATPSAANRRPTVEVFRCPGSGDRLRLDKTVRGAELGCPDGRSFPIVGEIPRFVEAEHYARSFGIQWNRWSATQIDSRNGTQIFRQRFERYLGDPASLAGQRVLDAGCGPGGFIDIVHPHPAELVGIDLSSAIDAAHRNFGHLEHLHLAQADLFSPPLEPESFDTVYCFGVIQSTPDPEGAFAALARLVKPGGKLAVWIYERSWFEPVKPKHLLRRYTTRLPEERAMRFCERYAMPALRLRQSIKRLPHGRALAKVVPVPDIYNWPDGAADQLDDSQIEEWTVMDTHDWLISAYEINQTPQTVRSWFERYGFEPPQRRGAGGVSMLATKST